MRRRSVANPHPNYPPQLLGGRIPLVSLIQTLAVAEHLSFRHTANVLGVAHERAANLGSVGRS
jgi:hypothetical protein